MYRLVDTSVAIIFASKMRPTCNVHQTFPAFRNTASGSSSQTHTINICGYSRCTISGLSRYCHSPLLHRRSNTNAIIPFYTFCQLRSFQNPNDQKARPVPTVVPYFTYTDDTTLNPIHRDVIHEIYQIISSGPCHIKNIESSLSEGSLAVARKEGGIDMFIDNYARFFLLEKTPQGLIVKKEEPKGGKYADQVLKRIQEIMQTRNGKRISSSDLWSMFDQKDRMALKRTKESIDLFLRRRSRYFKEIAPLQFIAVDANASKGEENTTASRSPSGLAAPKPHTEDFSPASLLKVMMHHLPYNSFISFRKAFEVLREADQGMKRQDPSYVFKIITSYSNDVADMRTLPSCPNCRPGASAKEIALDQAIPIEDKIPHTYMRLVGLTSKYNGLLENGDADEKNSDLDITWVGPILSEILMPYGEIPMADVPKLVQQHSSQNHKHLLINLPIKDHGHHGANLPLIFDRLQHYFDVDHLRLRVKALSPEERQDKSLSLLDTPTPQALRASMAILDTAPLPPDMFEAKMGARRVQEATNAFGSLPKFVSAHKSHLFLHDGMLWTPRLYNKEGMKGAPNVVDNNEYDKFKAPTFSEPFDPEDSGLSFNHSVPHISIKSMTGDQLALYLHSCLPHNRYVSWSKMRYMVDASVFKHKELETGDPRDFFEKKPMLFQTFCPYYTNGFIIGRAGLDPPLGVVPVPTNVIDIYKEIAMLCPGGENESTVMSLISRDARAVIKRMGGLEHVVQQVPQWFDSINPTEKAGSSIVTYIGHKMKVQPITPTAAPIEIKATADEDKNNKGVDEVPHNYDDDFSSYIIPPPPPPPPRGIAYNAEDPSYTGEDEEE